MTSATDDTIAAEPSGSSTQTEPRHAPLRLEPGAVFAGRYEIEALLGRGGMGAVYRVRDQTLGEVVALKLLTLDSAQAQERFLSEVRLARRVTHPNVARVHDFGEDGPVRFLTMEYVPGDTLETLVASHAPMDTTAVVKFGRQIAAGLAAAHAAEVIHRDLKPANVLVGDDDRVVITDFGIARAVSHASGTRTGTMLGTPHYMSPEQVLGRTVDARSDLYAFGVLLYELATGALPFERDSAVGIALARVQACPIDPRSHHPVDDPLAALIMRCLAREAEARPASADIVGRQLLALAGGPAVTLESIPTPAEASGPHAPYAPISVGTQAIAILPFAYRGAPDHDYLGEAMAEELTDVLTRTRGLRVLSMGATRRFAETRDPTEIAEALDADAIIDGTVQHTGGRMRLSVRMIEPDGTQQWAERYDGRLEDVFELQESLGRRVAEALRIALDVAPYRCTAPAEAIEKYLRARRLLREHPMVWAEDAVDLLEHSLRLAPDFPPALATHAMGAVRAWWGYDIRKKNHRYVEQARKSVARAQQLAPMLAETHLAKAMLEVQSGGFIAAAKALSNALELAPTMAEAQQYLGQLQSEAGRAEEAKERLQLALTLDPSLHFCRYPLARLAHFDGDTKTSAEHLGYIWKSVPKQHLATITATLRLALYRGDQDEARRLWEQTKTLGTPASNILAKMVGLLFGETPLDEAMQLYQGAYRSMTNGRFMTMIRQIVTELLTLSDAHEPALRELQAAADTALIDVVWMRRCTVLDPLRDSPMFKAALNTVERRVALIWHG